MALAQQRAMVPKAQSEKVRAAPQGERPTKSKKSDALTAYPAGIVTSTASADPSAQVHTFPRQRLSLRRKAAIRRAELIRGHGP
jgi:hypothetical protein